MAYREKKWRFFKWKSGFPCTDAEWLKSWLKWMKGLIEMKKTKLCLSTLGSLRNRSVSLISEGSVLMFIQSFTKFLEYMLFSPSFIARDMHVSLSHMKAVCVWTPSLFCFWTVFSIKVEGSFLLRPAVFKDWLSGVTCTSVELEGEEQEEEQGWLCRRLPPRGVCRENLEDEWRIDFVVFGS